MTEKYRIYLSKETKGRLAYDAEMFDFLKKDHSVNLNAFLKTLIVNYFNEYRKQEKHINDQIVSILKSSSNLCENDIETISSKILALFFATNDSNEVNDSTLTLTVSGQSYDIIQIIEKNLLHNIGMSEYLRRMFLSFLSMPRSKREKIIFLDSFSKISEAINKERIISFSITYNPEKKFTVFPYAIVPSKQEQYNYMLCFDVEKSVTRSFRISRIRNIFMRSESFCLNDDSLRKLKLAKDKGPQFTFDSTEEVCVIFSNEGIRKFNMVYTNRPEIMRKDGNKYYFQWPIVQLEEYFKRFGKDAIIIEPESSKVTMRKFYEEALAKINEYIT